MVALRKARRKFGTRTSRRANTNGKIIQGKGGGRNQKVPCYRFPRPAKRVCVKIQAYIKAQQKVK